MPDTLIKTEYNRLAKKRTGRSISILFLSAIITGIAVSVLLLRFSLFIRTPASKEKTKIVINIPKGMNTKGVAALLKKKGIIKKNKPFLYLALLSRKTGKIQAGEYSLSPSMPPKDILNIITKGETLVYSATIPEGLNFKEISILLSKKDLADKERFLNLKSDKRLLEFLGNHAESLEGYLFPDTYYFRRGMSEFEIIKKMISKYKKEMTPDLKKRAKEIGLTEHQVVTFASLIEKETGNDSERRLISAVFHNRIKKNMKLQCDPTVIYALGESFDGNIRKKDLMIRSPYNTYLYRGLPPGPIASPGIESIKAVLYPEDVDYLYFVSKRDGTHHFSKTYKKHSKAVHKYQLSRNKQDNNHAF